MPVEGDDDILGFVNELKAQSGGDIHLAGGAALARSLVRLGLVDQYRLFVYPVTSPGLEWFGAIDEQREMELVSATAFSNGVAGLHYTPVGD